MDELTVTLRVITPLFLGGADPNAHPEIRPPSIKGALRFWYRAMDATYCPACEMKIFGGTDKGEGQAHFLLRVRNIKGQQIDPDPGKPQSGGIAYLGYGCIDKGKIIRSYFRAGTSFDLSIHFKPKTPAWITRSVSRALWALITFGGLGARSRRGFGALTAENDIPGLPPLKLSSREDLKASIERFLADTNVNPNLPEHTQWSSSARCIVTGGEKDGEALLNWLGSAIQERRSFRGAHRTTWAVNDHNLMRAFLNGTTVRPSAPPARTAFGLPHNYFFTSLGNAKGGVDLMEGKKHGRRASPLLLSVAELKADRTNSTCAVVSFLPAVFVPPGRELRIHGARTTHDVPPPSAFTPVTDLLNVLAAFGLKVRP